MIELLPALVFVAQATTATVPSSIAAPAEIVIYSDFQCPFCRQFAAPTRELRVNGLNGRPMTVTFKHFPLPFHRNAQLAHRAAEAAKAQGKFWEMHDLLFANQAHLGRADLLAYASTLGLDLTRFEKDLDSETTKSVVAADVAEGQRAGITATPSYFINGRLFEGTRTGAQLASLVQLSPTGLAQSEDRALQPGSRIPDNGSRIPDNGSRIPDPGSRTPAPTVPTGSEITDMMLSIGPLAAIVTIELYADLQSAISQEAIQAVETIQLRYPAAIRIQFRNYPLPFHSQAVLVHEAAMAAARSGKFWEFTRAVVANQSSMDENTLIAAARTVGLNTTEFADALRQHRYRSRLDADRDEAARRGVRGSPAIVVNGRRIDGVPSAEVLSRSVEGAFAELGRTSLARN